METSTPSPLSPLGITPAQNALKAVIIVVLFFVTFTACSMAFVLKRFAFGESEQHTASEEAIRDQQARRSKFGKIFSMVSCFGAGVFLGTCLLDLLPGNISSVQLYRERL